MARRSVFSPEKRSHTKTRAPPRGTTQGPREAWLWGEKSLLESSSQARLGWDCGAESAVPHRRPMIQPRCRPRPVPCPRPWPPPFFAAGCAPRTGERRSNRLARCTGACTTRDGDPGPATWVGGHGRAPKGARHGVTGAALRFCLGPGSALCRLNDGEVHGNREKEVPCSFATSTE